MSYSLHAHIWLCVWEHMNLRVCPGQVSAAAVRSCDLRPAFACCENIIASVYYYSTERQWECCVPCGPVKSGCRPGVCERKEVFYAHSLCSHRPAPSEARCIVGSGEAYWSWLVPAESQIEFWQAGETGSQRERPPPHTPPCPLQQTIEAAWQELFKTLHTLHSSVCHTNVGTHTLPITISYYVQQS